MNTVVFDLDDTLLHDDLTLSSFSVTVFRRLREKGFHVVAASGRAQLSMKPYVDQIGCLDAYISCNGAEIWDGQTHRLIRQELFSANTAVEIARFAEKHHCYAHVYEGDCFCYNFPCIYADRYAASAKLKGILAGPLSRYIREPRNKILMMDSEERISEMYREAVELFKGRASVTCSKPFYLEFNPVNATKGIALKTVCGYLGVRPEDSVAFGDSLNDLSMLRAAGISVAVLNCWKEIRPFCDFICGSNNGDGPAEFLNDRFLGGEVAR